MSWVGLLLLVAAGAAPRLTVPLPSEDAAVFLAAPNLENVPAVCVLDGGLLRVAPIEGGRPEVAVELPEGAALFDIAPVDADSAHDLIVVRGADVLRRPLEREGRYRKLFELEEPVARPAGGARPFPLAVRRGEQRLLALPQGGAIRLMDFSGGVLDEQPVQEPGGAVFEGQPFRAWPAGPASVGGPGGLEIMVHRQRSLTPLPLLSGEGEGEESARHDELFNMLFSLEPEVMRQAEACGLIARTGGGEYLAVVTPEGEAARDSAVRIAKAAGGIGADSPPLRMGPPRRYPGRVAQFHGEALGGGRLRWPDFNGDGFADLLLWKAPLPGRSVDAMARAVMTGSWPVRFTVHVFSPEKGRFEPRPAGRIETRLPVWRLLDLARGAPLRHGVFVDLNGDGSADCAFAPDAESYEVWLYRDGFPGKPSASYRFTSPIKRIVYAGRVGQGRGSVILLRTAQAAHLLDPGAD